MPKKLIQRYMPNKEKLHQQRALRIFGKLLHDGHLWHLNRRTVPKAVAIGLFCAFMPIPFQMVLAAAAAILWRANIPISVMLVWFTNPITIPPIFYGCYKVGAFILQQPVKVSEMVFSLEWIGEQFGHIWQPLLLGSLICGLIAGLLGYTIITYLWNRQILQARKRRKKTSTGK